MGDRLGFARMGRCIAGGLSAHSTSENPLQNGRVEPYTVRLLVPPPPNLRPSPPSPATLPPSVSTTIDGGDSGVGRAFLPKKEPSERTPSEPSSRTSWCSVGDHLGDEAISAQFEVIEGKKVCFCFILSNTCSLFYSSKQI